MATQKKDQVLLFFYFDLLLYGNVNETHV